MLWQRGWPPRNDLSLEIQVQSSLVFLIHNHFYLKALERSKSRWKLEPPWVKCMYIQNHITRNARGSSLGQSKMTVDGNLDPQGGIKSIVNGECRQKQKIIFFFLISLKGNWLLYIIYTNTSEFIIYGHIRYMIKIAQRIKGWGRKIRKINLSQRSYILREVEQ